MLSDDRRGRGDGASPPILMGALSLLISSSVAGAATAPFSAAHFNQIANYGLIANLVSVPLMGALVMPAGVIAGLLWSVGLEAVALVPMGWGLAWILSVAHWVAAFDGTVTQIAAPGPWVLPLLSLGALWVILWVGPARWCGTLIMGAALLLWTQSTRPDLLISQTGGLVGAMTDQGRALSKPRGDGFAAKVWLENDGDRLAQELAADRGVWQRGKGWAATTLGEAKIHHLTGKTGAKHAAEACATGGLVVVSAEPEAAPDGPCSLITTQNAPQNGRFSRAPLQTDSWS